MDGVDATLCSRNAHKARERRDEERIVVQRGRALEPNFEPLSNLLRPHVHVEQELDVIGHEADGDDHDIPDPARGELLKVLAEVRPGPGLRHATG